MAQNFTKFDFSLEGKLGKVKLGESVAKNDLLEIDSLTGKAIKVKVTNYAAVGNVDHGTAQTNTATGQISAQTLLTGGRGSASSRNAVVVNSSGDIFTLSVNTSINGAVLSRFNPDGTLYTSLILNSSGNASSNFHILLLSNGNIAVLYSIVGDLVYGVYTGELVLIKAITIISAINTNFWAATQLIGGGFSVTYQDNTNPLKSKIAVYDNTGTVSLAPTDIWTRTGTTGAQYHRIVQLSNTNLAIAISSINTVSSIGLYYGVYTTAGVQIKAFTSALDSISCGWFPEIAAHSGFFSIAISNGTDQKAWVFNNAGILQGAEFTSATTLGNSSNRTKIVTNGTDFWLIWHKAAGAISSTKLPSTGTNYVTNDIGPIVSGGGNISNQTLDAFYENGIIAIFAASTGSVRNSFWLIDGSLGLILTNTTTQFGSAASITNSGLYLRAIPGGDRSFICMYDYTSAAITALAIGKYAKTAVLGIADSSGVLDESIPVKTLANFSEINSINGSLSVAFDMNTNSLVGNKGTMLKTGGVVLKGLGA